MARPEPGDNAITRFHLEDLVNTSTHVVPEPRNPQVDCDVRYHLAENWVLLSDVSLNSASKPGPLVSRARKGQSPSMKNGALSILDPFIPTKDITTQTVAKFSAECGKVVRLVTCNHKLPDVEKRYRLHGRRHPGKQTFLHLK
ncbi:hypothetical protein FISHEDRAFT_55188 [Fistulina hepatica ATCC 64428]|uniref:Uncharacterized protein n=1 Tax=Fistulina hepatica ATCC 64428 TaxID=1128425 RepID=A0A0D7ANX1_9AGAR|nr:hypothetical protein FISHEDRAFT_55188 [Fistulina hepatica ATCC 64428]